MVTVTVEVIPWLTSYFGRSDSRRFVHPYTVQDGETLRGLIRGLVSKHPRLGEVALDRQTGDLGEYLTIVLNGRLLELHEEADPVLKAGDRVMLVPSFIGG